jgi:putative ABC transport system substrate-binding protein
MGYVRGRTLEVEERYETETFESLKEKARQLVALRVDAILTEGTPPTLAAQSATRTIPIVTTVGDPVAAGFAKELRRPGGNITGFSQNRSALARKQMEFVRLLRPRTTAIAIVYTKDSPASEIIVPPLVAAAQEATLAVHMIPYVAGQVDRVFNELKARHLETAVGFVEEADVGAFVRNRIALFVASEEQVERGGLLSLVNDNAADAPEAAAMLVRIFNGDNPAEMPFSLPTRYKTTINARTAAALGINLAPEVLLRVDRIVR